ncbi:glycosyltransferase [Cytobacillus oceanisediminis]|uniref:glycosyltransferase n=1 Tax=Cytobacillus oceanisediminis TaxID=665099 RepID=UPI001C21930C|nr:glycosyltransferase [Cytobacillus oceanisediminis]MBU8731719.1 glycosyltransferase [Cytobacillus oceanisediminis]
MGEKVCMFVWNHFTNDARVLRECTSLSESGYDVDLVCIHDPKEKNMPYFEERSENFHIYRVKRYPETLVALQRLYRFLIKNKGIGTLFLILWILLCFYLPIIFVPATVLIFLILKTELKRIIIKGNVVVRMILRGFSKNYVIYHSNDLNTLPQGYICAKWRISRKKLIYDSHEVQTSRTGYDGPFHGWLEKFLVKKVDSMIVENHTRAKYNEDLYGFYPNVVHNYPFKQISNSTEKVNIHEMLNLPADEKILLYQGGIQIGRGLDKLIQAAPYFHEGTLVLVGDGKIKPQLVKMVDEMGLNDRVKFIPKVPLSDLPKFTRNAYLGFQVLNNVCFNHYSASSNKLFEYMMAGVPVVACEFPEIKRVVEGEKTGICVNSHDHISIVNAVNYLIENPNFRDELSNNCFVARYKYNWDTEKHEFLKIYNA